MSSKTRGGLLIVSGPSGAGKSTIVRQLVGKGQLPIRVSISATTRSPRAGEEEGLDYYFIEQKEFDRIRDKDGFLECFEVFGPGYWYGTLRSEVERLQDEETWVLLEIDVEGTDQVLRKRPDAVTIFISPGSMEELERRLRGRGTETEESIRSRLVRARDEMKRAADYQHVVVNGTVAQAVDDIIDIISSQQPGNG